MFTTFLEENKKNILSSLHDFFTYQKSQAINSWGLDAITRLEEYCSGGKMIRGSLVFLGHLIAGGNVNPDLIKIASAMELIQAGLLIHDDIMDNDKLRREKPSVHTQYTNHMLQENTRYPKNTGTSLGICIGDAAFFLGYQLLNQLKDQDIRQKITHIFSKELTNVSFAQMQDVYSGASQRKATLDDILSLYQHKTGMYSIALPLMAGAIIAGATKETLRHVEKFGANLGVVFQLTDDRLNLFGDPKITGKPIGSDIREGKQTPYFFFLSQVGDTKTSDIFFIRKKTIEYGIDKKINHLIQTYTTSAQEAIQKIPMKNTQKKLILSFVDYLTHRVK